MSVIAFSAQELAPIVAYLSLGPTSRLSLTFTLVLISEANVAAYNHSYSGEDAKPATAAEITAALATLQPRSHSLRHEAAQTAASLHYNCIANNGTHFLSTAALQDLVGILSALLSDIVA